MDVCQMFEKTKMTPKINLTVLLTLAFLCHPLAHLQFDAQCIEAAPCLTQLTFISMKACRTSLAALSGPGVT